MNHNKRGCLYSETASFIKKDDFYTSKGPFNF